MSTSAKPERAEATWRAFDVIESEASPSHKTALAHYGLAALDLSKPRSLIPIAEALADVRSKIAAARFVKSDASDAARADKRKVNKCKEYRKAAQALTDLEGAESVLALFLDVSRKVAGVPK